MVSAADYPVVDVLWMTIAFFCWIAWIWPLMPVLTLAGPVDRELLKRADPLPQLLTLERDGAIVLDVSGVDEVNGALIGLLLRASRRLAWRNRQAGHRVLGFEHSRRLRIAGLDELATLRESG